MSLKNPNLVNPRTPKKIAIVISNPAVSESTGWPVGFWWSELTHPYFAFREKGYEVEVFSNDGGKCEPDAMSDPRDESGYSATDLITLGFVHSEEAMNLVNETGKVSEIDVNKFDAIVVAGGQAPMSRMEKDVEVQKKFFEFYQEEKIVAALCHGVAVLRYCVFEDGTPLVNGKTVTGFANVEEDFADNAVWDYGMLERGRASCPGE